MLEAFSLAFGGVSNVSETPEQWYNMQLWSAEFIGHSLEAWSTAGVLSRWTAEILPGWKLQIKLSPVEDENGYLAFGPGPAPDGAPQVISTYVHPRTLFGLEWIEPSCREPGLQSR